MVVNIELIITWLMVLMKKNNTVYEFHGCFWHGHACGTNYNEEKWKQILEREHAI